MIYVLVKKYLLFPLLSLAVLAFIGYQAYIQLSQRLEKSQRQLDSLRQQVNRLDREVSFLRQQLVYYLRYGEQYKKISANLVKPLDRLVFSDQFYRLSQIYNISHFAITFRPQRAVSGLRAGNTDIRNGLLVANPVRLRWDGPSDVDHFRIVNFYNLYTSPYFRISECGMVFNGDVASFDLAKTAKENVGLISIDCEMFFISAMPREHDHAPD
jgi:cell division protein FtsB